MRNKRNYTKSTVRLRKSEYRDEWHVYIESYPVMVEGKDKPQRIREYINRSVKTVVFDKKKISRTTSGKTTYKPKRDDNGIIICKSDLDKETMLYADSIRKIIQQGFDERELNSELRNSQISQQEKAQENFIQYFKKIIGIRHKKSSKSIIINWHRTVSFLEMFVQNDILSFEKIDYKFIEDFKRFLLDAPCGGGKKGTISQNTASTYFSIFKASLKQAFVDGYFQTDISAKTKGIVSKDVRREYLTNDELDELASTPCANDLIRRASLFSALTGLRHSDIQKLKWSEISIENGQPKLNFTQKKTKGVEYTPISEQALLLCGEFGKPDDLVFEGLMNAAWINRPLKKWILDAGISKNITFHCFRHTFATLQIANGTDIYIVKDLLGHTNVKTTQIYAKVMNEKKNEAVKTIKLNIKK